MAGVGSGGRVAFEASSRRRAVASIRWSAATSANRLRQSNLQKASSAAEAGVGAAGAEGACIG